MSCFWEGFLTFILGMIGFAVYLGLFAGAGYLIGQLFGRDHDDCGGFIFAALAFGLIFGGGVLVGLSECGII